VYGTCVLTIARVGARDSRDGLFADWTKDPLSPFHHDGFRSYGDKPI
jgi:hypothetical protein